MNLPKAETIPRAPWYKRFRRPEFHPAMIILPIGFLIIGIMAWAIVDEHINTPFAKCQRNGGVVTTKCEMKQTNHDMTHVVIANVCVDTCVEPPLWRNHMPVSSQVHKCVRFARGRLWLR